MAARQFGAKPEARRAVRRLVNLECQVYCELWGEPIPHRVTDVSEDGLWIQTDLLLEMGTEVTLTFYPPDWDAPLHVAGTVQRVLMRSRADAGGPVGMGIGFEALRTDERRRLTQSMRCLRARESYILDQRTLTGVPVGFAEPGELPTPEDRGRTVVGWAAPSAAPSSAGRRSRITATSVEPRQDRAASRRAFPGGLDLAASVFSPEPSD
jgi:hypothetical protein